MLSQLIFEDMKRLNKLIGCGFFSAGLLGLAAVSCTNYLDPEPVVEEYDLPEDDAIVRKVLMISVDGLVGAELKKELPANIEGLLANSKYTFESFADENTTDPATWATMMTGVGYAKHHIDLESYIPEPDPSDSHRPTPYFPSVFSRIFEQDPGMNTVAVTQSSGLANILLTDATTSALVSGDEQAKNLATTGELTIETKMKVNRNQTSTRLNLRGFHQYWESGFFGKDSHTSQATPGWMFYSAGNNTQVVVSDGAKSARASRERLHSTWYHFTTVLKAEDSSLTIQMFHNGTLFAETVTPGMNIANIKTQDPLMFGYRPNRSQYDDWVDFDLADVRIWNKALSENQVREVACMPQIPSDYPLHANLKGVWRMHPNSSGEIVNEINNGDVMTISGDFQPKIMKYFTPCGDGEASDVLIEGVDFAPQIFYWLDVSVRDSWGIEGQNFLKNFEIEFIK